MTQQYKRMQFTPSVKTVSGILNEIVNLTRGGLDLRPEYQREYIWKDDFKDKLVYSVIRGYPIGSVSIGVLNSPNKNMAMSEVVDGQQRLTCLFNFIKSEYEIKHEYARKICEDIKMYLINEIGDRKIEAIHNKLNSSKKFKLTYEMLPVIIQNNILNYQISISNISESTPEHISEYFKFLQNQEILRAGEIINAIPETNFKNYLNAITSKKDFLTAIGYSKDTRREFDKLFYGAIAVLDEQINFGSADKAIKTYIAESNGNLSDKTKKRVTLLINGINEISLLNINTVEEKSKRFIKFLFLLLGFNLFQFNNVSMEQALIKLSEINKRLSAFTSAKKNIINETFAIFQETGIINNIIEDYRQISLFARGAHAYDKTVTNINLLHKIIKRELEADYLSR